MQKQSLDVTVQAVSKSAIEDYKGKFDILLLGPHFQPNFLNIKAFMNLRM